MHELSQVKYNYLANSHLLKQHVHNIVPDTEKECGGIKNVVPDL